MIVNTVADVGPQDFHPSSSSLADALGWGTGPHTDHTSRVDQYGSCSGASVRARDENEAGPSGESHDIPDEQAPGTLPAPQTFGQAEEADAEETSTITEGNQGTVSFFYYPCILQLIVCFTGDSVPGGGDTPANPA